MLLGTAYKGRSDPVCIRCPLLRTFPSVLRHQITERITNSGGDVWLFIRIGKCSNLILPNADDNHSGT